MNFIERHRKSATDFTRACKLTFTVMFILILKKSIKSIQLILNEFILAENKDYTVTAGAFTKARKKFKHTAFIELNEDIVEAYYKDDDIKRYEGLRVVAFDGSRITLPNASEIKDEFGVRSIGNATGGGIGEYSRATFMSCYDVLNNIAIESTLGSCEAYEPDLADIMLHKLKPDDLAIFDRGFASYAFMANLINHKMAFIIRCPKSSFKSVQKMFDENAASEEIVTIKVPYKHKEKIAKNKLPNEINIRLVRIILPTGEIEVLATSMYKLGLIKHDQFEYLYNTRWGVETYFSKLKGRLNLENFTGKSSESVKQDFWSTIFISNLETLMTEDIDNELAFATKTASKTKVKVNKSVSFNTIKNKAFDIFYYEADKRKIFEQLDKLFRMNLVSVRNDRKVPRVPFSNITSYNYQKRKRKHVF